MPDLRESKFTLLLSAEERDMLSELAKEDGLSMAMYLRRLIRVHSKRLRYDLDLIAGGSVG